MLKDYVKEKLDLDDLNQLDDLSLIELEMDLENKGLKSELKELQDYKKTLPKSRLSFITVFGGAFVITGAVTAVYLRSKIVKKSRELYEVTYKLWDISSMMEDNMRSSDEVRKFLISEANSRINEYNKLSKTINLAYRLSLSKAIKYMNSSAERTRLNIERISR